MCNRAESQFTSPDLFVWNHLKQKVAQKFLQLRSNSGVFLVVKEKGCLRMYLTRILAVSTDIAELNIE